MSAKTYVLDTNVLLLDPEAIFKFEDNTVVLPMTVIEEIDGKKTKQDEIGRNARQVGRNLKALRLAKCGKLVDGVALDNGGTLRADVTLKRTLDRLPLDLDEDVNDNRILAVAMQCDGILVTNDSALAIKADGLGVETQDYESNRVKVDGMYGGTGTIHIGGHMIDQLYQLGYMERSWVGRGDFEAVANQFFILHDVCDKKHSALVRYDKVMDRFNLLPPDFKTLGLSAKNSEQRFALDALLDPSISLVTMIGLAGSGKTLLSIAAGLHGVMESQLYKKVLLLKPVVAMDNNHQIGFLPGSMNEKLAPWMASYMDNIDFIMNVAPAEEKATPKNAPLKNKTKMAKVMAAMERDRERDKEEKDAGRVSIATELIEHGFIEIGSMEHIRGRSLPNQYIIIDEAQNLSVNSIKTLITRAGEGTKIILLGDIEQIDAPYLDASSNGLTYVADKFKGQTIAGHITLTKSERSKLAEIAANIL